MDNSSKEFTNFILNAILFFFLCRVFISYQEQEQTILFLELNVIYHIYYSFTL
jgi:hypothetical protein